MQTKIRRLSNPPFVGAGLAASFAFRWTAAGKQTDAEPRAIEPGAFYGVSAPLVNASRKPGEWQTYDIIFHSPRPGADGKVEPGSVTVLHNGVLIQDQIPVKGEATTAAQFAGVASKAPLMLQD